MSTNLYHISHELQNLIDWKSIYKMPRKNGSPDDQMKGLFVGATVVAHWSIPGQIVSIVATCVKLTDGRYLLYKSCYGSRIQRNYWVNATDEEVKQMCINIANGAYIFTSLKDVVSFLSQDEREMDDCGWWECAKPLLKGINLYLFKCALLRMGFDVVAKEEDTWVLMIATNIKFLISACGESLSMELVTSDEETILNYADIPYLLNFPKDEIIAGVITPHINRLFGIYLDRQIRHNYMGALRGEKPYNKNILSQIVNGSFPVNCDVSLDSLQLCPVCGKMQKFCDISFKYYGLENPFESGLYPGGWTAPPTHRNTPANIMTVRCSHCGTKFEIRMP